MNAASGNKPLHTPCARQPTRPSALYTLCWGALSCVHLAGALAEPFASVQYQETGLHGGCITCGWALALWWLCGARYQRQIDEEGEGPIVPGVWVYE